LATAAELPRIAQFDAQRTGGDWPNAGDLQQALTGFVLLQLLS
jgi:hypothetical protein